MAGGVDSKSSSVESEVSSEFAHEDVVVALSEDVVVALSEEGVGWIVVVEETVEHLTTGTAALVVLETAG